MSHREMLIMVPGVNLDGGLFADQRAALEFSHEITIANNHSDDTIAAMAERLLHKAPDRFALAGLSMGGYVALEVMRKAPERVTRLALLDTTARPDTEETRDRRERMIVLAEGGCFEKTHKMLWDRLVHPDHQEDRILEARVLQMMRATGARAFIRQQRAIMGRKDSRPHLADIKAPTLVLVGREDVTTPVEQAREMADAIPKARLAIVEKCGHLSPLEQPAAVTDALLDWLKMS